MKKFSAIVFCFLICTSTAYAGILDDLRWEARVLVVSDETGGSDTLTQQISVFDKDGLADRDMVVLVLNRQATTIIDYRNGTLTVSSGADEIREQLSLSKSNFSVVLVGKDGGVKLRRDMPVTEQELFDLIDSMPMRIEEMGGH